MICFCGSFRGPEVFLVDLYGLNKYLAAPRRVQECDYVIIPLLGQVKNEIGERYHLIPLCSTTKSGLPVERWVKCLADTQIALGHTKGLAFCTASVTVAHMKDYELELLDRLHLFQMQDPSLIPPDVNVHEEYGLNRSFHRGSTSEARSRNVPGRDVDLANRWHSFENAKGCRPRLAMHDHNSDICILIPALVRYSHGL